MEEESRVTRLNSDAQEVMKNPQILHGKLLLQGLDSVLEQALTGHSEDDVVDIE